MEVMENKVMEHDFAIDNIGKTIEKLVETTEDSNKKINEIAKCMGRQEVILEKLTSLEARHNDNVNNINDKVNNIEDKIKDINIAQNNLGCNALQMKSTELSTLNKAIYGKDGRGGLIFDVEEIKKFMYKSMGFFTLLNVIIMIVISKLLG